MQVAGSLLSPFDGFLSGFFRRFLSGLFTRLVFVALVLVMRRRGSGATAGHSAAVVPAAVLVGAVPLPSEGAGAEDTKTNEDGAVAFARSRAWWRKTQGGWDGFEHITSGFPAAHAAEVAKTFPARNEFQRVGDGLHHFPGVAGGLLG